MGRVGLETRSWDGIGNWPVIRSGPDASIILIDGQMMARLLLEHNVGVSRDRVYEIKKVDGDYFEE